MSGAVEGVEAHARELAHRIIMEFRPNGWQAKEDELYRLLLSRFESLTTPSARSYADEDVARIIDPGAWMDHAEFTRKSAEEPGRERANEWLAAAEQSVAKSLAKAAAIRLLSQGGKA